MIIDYDTAAAATAADVVIGWGGGEHIATRMYV